MFFREDENGDLIVRFVKEINFEVWFIESFFILLDVLYKLVKIKYKFYILYYLFEWIGMRYYLGFKVGIFKCYRSYSGVVYWLKLLNFFFLSYIYLWLFFFVLLCFYVFSWILLFFFYSLCLIFFLILSNKC